MSEKIFDAIKAERLRQEDTWGQQNHDPMTWLTILTEEVGEACAAALEGRGLPYRDEMVQVAAVAVAAIDCLERRGGDILESVTDLQRRVLSLEGRCERLTGERDLYRKRLE